MWTPLFYIYILYYVTSHTVNTWYPFLIKPRMDILIFIRDQTKKRTHKIIIIMVNTLLASGEG